MDPLSAFALAGNVLQVVDFGLKVISKTVEYRSSDNAVLAEHGDLRGVAESLHSMNDDLKTFLESQTVSRQLGPEESHLIKTNEECLRISKAFVQELDALKIPEKRTLLNAVRVSLKALWNQKKIENLQKTISQARNNLNVALLVYINSKQATHAAQVELHDQSSLAERRILNEVTGASTQIQEEIQRLGEKISDLNLCTSSQVTDEFMASHGNILQRFSTLRGTTLLPEKGGPTCTNSTDLAHACNNILKGLHFPQVNEREEQVPQAYLDTYQWILEPSPHDSLPWDSFVSWLGDPLNEDPIYWIHGKIGAGKTVLLRFLNETLDVKTHMSPWAEGALVLKANYFFWSAGNQLQKSVVGLLRTLLSIILEQIPEVIPDVVPHMKWQTAKMNSNHNTQWTKSELISCLKVCISRSYQTRKFFILVDGLDEVEGSDESRMELLDLIHDLASMGNTKICLSSRPWNIFAESLGRCPQMRLELLTQADIKSYVEGCFTTNQRFKRLSDYDKISAVKLIDRIIAKAAGVFLWVRLVVKQLMQGLRDGDGIRMLNDKLDAIPEDLENYLDIILESIESSHRFEASKIFQIALFIENDFASLHSICLLDLTFVEERSQQFALDGSYGSHDSLFHKRDALAFRLDSTLRKLNSRCLGLLECHKDTSESLGVQRFHLEHDDDAEYSDVDHVKLRSRGSQQLSKAIADIDESNALKAAGWSIAFSHRSVRDFLLSSRVQSRLHQYSQGLVDARLFLLNARIVQLMALGDFDICSDTTLGLASNILCCLATQTYQDTEFALKATTRISPVLEKLALLRPDEPSIRDWYINLLIESWHSERSNTLTAAIDFGINAYVRHHLTKYSVNSKKGRPILDHLLRPRFIGSSLMSVFIGYQLPNLELLRTTLEMGADPNQKYKGTSLWALFICQICDHFHYIGSGISEEEEKYIQALELLVHHGADLLLPFDSICKSNYYETWYYNELVFARPKDYVEHRFPGAQPMKQQGDEQNSCYLVSDLLQSLGPYLESSIEGVRSLVLQREAQEMPELKRTCWTIS